MSLNCDENYGRKVGTDHCGDKLFLKKCYDDAYMVMHMMHMVMMMMHMMLHMMMMMHMMTIMITGGGAEEAARARACLSLHRLRQK